MRNLRADRREDRQAQAKERAEDRAKLTPQQQLARLDYKLGAGVGAKSERKRLAEQVENEKKANQLGVKTLRLKEKK